MLNSLEIIKEQSLLLTGTPVQNNLKELGSLLRFCCPSVFLDPVDGGISKWFDPPDASKTEVKENLDQLNELIKP